VNHDKSNAETGTPLTGFRAARRYLVRCSPCRAHGECFAIILIPATTSRRLPPSDSKWRQRPTVQFGQASPGRCEPRAAHTTAVDAAVGLPKRHSLHPARWYALAIRGWLFRTARYIFQYFTVASSSQAGLRGPGVLWIATVHVDACRCRSPIDLVPDFRMVWSWNKVLSSPLHEAARRAMSPFGY
jgi:hypothetical protein